MVVVTEERVLQAWSRWGQGCCSPIPTVPRDTPQRTVWPQMSGLGRGRNGGSEQGFLNFSVHTNLLGIWVEMQVIVYEQFQKRQSHASHPLLTLSLRGHLVFTTGGAPGIKQVEARMLLSPPQGPGQPPTAKNDPASATTGPRPGSLHEMPGDWMAGGWQVLIAVHSATWVQSEAAGGGPVLPNPAVLLL